MSLPTAADKKKLLAMLDDLSRAVEELLLSGLTTATDTTRQTLEISFKAASQLQLLRLGATLRVATEELGRYARQEETFSRKRFGFFLHRAWMLSRGMQQALRDENVSHWEYLIRQPPGQPVEALDVVTLGVSKRVVPQAFCAFEFRLRTISDGGEALPTGAPVVWSCVFPLKPGKKIMSEAFLHLQHKQKFKAADFLEKKVIRIENARLAHEASLSRLTLTESSQVTLLEPFEHWESLYNWDVDRAIERVTQHDTTPFDLEIELQEEIVLPEWRVEAEIAVQRERMIDVPIVTPGATFYASVGLDDESQGLRKTLKSWQQTRKTHPPLYGILHYDLCRLMVQPLSVLEPTGPVPLTIAKTHKGAAELLRSLKF